jgi:uncharacterized protein YndB with AHSA1/START domain
MRPAFALPEADLAAGRDRESHTSPVLARREPRQSRRSDRRALGSRGSGPGFVHTGVLVHADISGYTRYVSRTAIQDSSATVRELLGVLVHEIGGTLEPAQFEGDSVTFAGDVEAHQMVDLLERAYVAFKRRLREMQKCNTCTCDACARTTDLALKFIAHRGEYAWQPLGGRREQLHGPDVNKSFRLLKNHVPLDEYLLLTSPLLDDLRPDSRAEYTAHVEEYEHVGRVECGYRPLGPVWVEATARERLRVSPEEAQLYSEVTVPTSIDLTWRLLTEPDSIRRLHGLQDIKTRAGARGTELGAVYTCQYADPSREPEVIRVTDSDHPSEHSVVYERGSTGALYMTAYLRSDGAATRVGTAWLWESGRRKHGFTRTSVKLRADQLNQGLLELADANRNPK